MIDAFKLTGLPVLDILIASVLGLAGLALGGTFAYILIKARAARGRVEPTNSYTDELRKNMLPTGFYVICGRQRVGKTSLGAAMMITDYKYHAGERLAKAAAEIAKMNAIPQAEPYNLHCPDLAYRSKDNILLDAKNWIQTYHFDIPQFALPDGIHSVQYFPPYTFLHAAELDAFMNSRTWQDDKDLKLNIIDAIKWIGHQEITFIGDAQSFGRLDAAVRALATDMLYVLKMKPVEKWRRKPGHLFRHEKIIEKVVWDFIWVKPQLKAEAEELSKLGITVPPSEFSRRCRFIYEGNIFERYDDKSGKAYWYRGIEDFYLEEHPSVSLARDDVADFCARNVRISVKKDEKANKIGNDEPGGGSIEN
jgi:hypothetical protein